MDPLSNSAFTTSGALIDCLDKKMVLVLRDNTKLFGVLRSFDQYGNLVFQDSYERIYVDNCYADIPKGVYLIRGENVVLMGEIVSAVILKFSPDPSRTWTRRTISIINVYRTRRQNRSQKIEWKRWFSSKNRGQPLCTKWDLWIWRRICTYCSDDLQLSKSNRIPTLGQ